MPAISKWSIKYDKCVKCGGTEYPHKGRGLCQLCYERESNIRHGSHIQRHIQKDRFGRSISSRRKPLKISEHLTEEVLKREYSVMGRSLTDIAREYNCTRQYIHKLLKKYGIPRKTLSEARKLAVQRKKLKYEKEVNGESKRIYLEDWTVNKNFFKSWTPQMAYVLGFIYADGSLHEARRGPKAKTTSTSPRCDISQKSPEILEKIKAVMSCNKKLYKTKNRPRGYIYHLALTDEEIYNDLLKLGLTPAKSNIVKFPEMPPEYIRHFIRGCWDGDGSVYYESIGKITASYVSGSFEFMEGMLYELVKAGFPERTIYKKRSEKRGNPPSYYFKFYGSQCQQLCHYLYDKVPQSQYLNRKYDIFQSCLRKPYRKMPKSRPVRMVERHFCVRYIDEDGKRKRKYFWTDVEAKEFRATVQPDMS